MRIQIPFCTPFEIVGHRPGRPVRNASTNDTSASTLRTYLPIQLRRVKRPAWANENNFRPSSARSENASATQINTGAAESMVTAASENISEASRGVGVSSLALLGLEATSLTTHEINATPASAHAVDATRNGAESYSPELRTLANWVIEGPPVEHEQRSEVEREILRCWASTIPTEVAIYDLALLTSLPPIPPNVTKLDVCGCTNLVTPPALMEGSQIKEMSFLMCASLRDAPDVSHCAELESLTLQDCVQITRPPDISGCMHLTELSFLGCERLARLPDLVECPELQTLDISDCRALTGSLPLSPCSQLNTLIMSGCSAINGLELSRCDRLTDMFVQDCSALRTLPSCNILATLISTAHRWPDFLTISSRCREVARLR